MCAKYHFVEFCLEEDKIEVYTGNHAVQINEISIFDRCRDSLIYNKENLKLKSGDTFNLDFPNLSILSCFNIEIRGHAIQNTNTTFLFKGTVDSMYIERKKIKIFRTLR